MELICTLGYHRRILGSGIRRSTSCLRKEELQPKPRHPHIHEGLGWQPSLSLVLPLWRTEDEVQKWGCSALIALSAQLHVIPT